jgi:HAD superfamily hydrolase (TIGR01509 family)
MQQTQLIIFDCDGVLIDSEVLACECAVEALRGIGMQIDLDGVFHRFLGRSRSHMLAAARAEGLTLPDDFVEQLEHLLVRTYEERLAAIDGMAEALAALTAQGLRVCVGSSSPPHYLERTLSLTGLMRFFRTEHLFSASMVERGKPAPDLFLYAARQMGVAPEACAVVEDSLAGVEAAQAAGMRTLWFLGGSHIDLERRPLDSSLHPAACRFDQMRDLPNLLETPCPAEAR